MMRIPIKVAILTDIQGLEDFLGDMDFKVAGTKNGITAIQMDIKIKGIDREILKQALEQARIGRLHILDSMLKVIDKPREELSPYAPKIIQTTIHPDKIRDVIGPGGKVINKIIAETGVKIDIEDDGHVFISSPNQESAERALEIIKGLTKDVEAGDIYNGKVVQNNEFWCICRNPAGQGRIGAYIQARAHDRVDKVEDVVSVGDEISVKVTEM
jgi:polyribonucleotide nucleotidyltransferase